MSRFTVTLAAAVLLGLLVQGQVQAQSAVEVTQALSKIRGIAGIGTSGGGNVHYISIGGVGQDYNQVMREVMKLRPGLKHLRELKASFVELTDAGAKEIHGLPELQELQLYNNRITDAGVEQFKQLPSLKMIALNDNKITGVGFKNPKELPNLDSLYLQGCPISDAGLDNIADHANLRNLAVSGRGITDAGMKHLARLKLLDKLYFTDARISDAGLRELKDSSVHLLRLTNTPVSGAGFEDYKSLHVLELGGSHITDVGLKGLAGLKNLHTLDLSGTRVTNAGIKELLPLKNVSTLNLSGTKVAGAALKELGAMKNLHTVLLNPEQIDDAALVALIDADLLRLYAAAGKMPGTPGRPRNNADIARLMLPKAAITDEGLKALATLKALELVNLRGTQVTDAGIAELKKTLPKLKVLR